MNDERTYHFLRMAIWNARMFGLGLGLMIGFCVGLVSGLVIAGTPTP